MLIKDCSIYCESSGLYLALEFTRQSLPGTHLLASDHMAYLVTAYA